MMMNTPKLSTVCAAGVCAALGVGAANAGESSGAPLAQVASLAGDVLVDRGEALFPAESGMVLEDGKATLAFSNGCRDEIKGPAMRTITADGACADAGATSLTKVTAEVAASPDVLALERGATSQLTDNTIGLGILGAFTLGGVVWAASNDDDENNAAPPPPPPISP
jgi:hypothetical protein